MRSSRAKEKLPFLPSPLQNRWPLTARAPPAISRRAEGAGEARRRNPHGGTGPPEVAPRQMPCEEQLLEPRPAGRRHPQPQDAGRWCTQFVGSVTDLR